MISGTATSRYRRDMTSDVTPIQTNNRILLLSFWNACFVHSEAHRTTYFYRNWLLVNKGDQYHKMLYYSEKKSKKFAYWPTLIWAYLSFIFLGIFYCIIFKFLTRYSLWTLFNPRLTSNVPKLFTPRLNYPCKIIMSSLLCYHILVLIPI